MQSDTVLDMQKWGWLFVQFHSMHASLIRGIARSVGLFFLITKSDDYQLQVGQLGCLRSMHSLDNIQSRHFAQI